MPFQGHLPSSLLQDSSGFGKAQDQGGISCTEGGKPESRGAIRQKALHTLLNIVFMPLPT
jgi:hypothetical protein